MDSQYRQIHQNVNVNVIKQGIFRKRRILPVIALVLFVAAYAYYYPTLHNAESHKTVELTFASGKALPNARVAFATLLTGSGGEDVLDADDDVYFTSTRMLCYQILYAPETKTSLNAPCLVLVTPNVRPDKIARLQKDGATVIPVDFIRSDWATTDVSTWQFVLSKIYLWQMTEYDLIAFLDTDHVLLQPLDGLFTDPAVIVEKNKKLIEAIKEDEPTQPSEYLFAGTAEMTKTHNFPPKTAPEDFYNIDYFEAGMFVMRPSKEMFDFHMSILSIPKRFNPHLPEQNLWNYIYRRDGNMPWIQLDTSWSAHFPFMSDIEKGAKSLHDKFWFPAHPEMGPYLLTWRQRMLDYYKERDNVSRSHKSLRFGFKG